MQKAGRGRNFIASSRVAFALLAPAAAGCAPSPRAPASEACISPDATLQESRDAVLSSIERISGLGGTLLDRIRKVEGEAERLQPEACWRDAVRYVLDVHIPFAGNAFLGMKETIERLQEGILEAGEDAGRMRMVARRACAALETAEVTLESCLQILDAASLEMRRAGKE